MSGETGKMQSAPDDGGPSPVLDGRYRLLAETRLPQLDSPHAEAYEARDLQYPDRSLFAVLCRRDLPVRMDVLERTARLEHASVVKPLQWGVVDWPRGGGRRYAIVFRRPGGERMTGDPQAGFKQLRPEELKRTVVAPLVPLLKDLGDRLITHRAIRLETLFYTDDSRTETMLGECVSAPPGLDQPVIYETIENGMAERAGRSPGRPPDDLYAFGVLLAVLLTGATPCAGMSDQEIVAAKLKHGSYGALFGKTRIPLAMLEPLRGLLCDDADKRWTAADLAAWLQGRHPGHKQPALPPKAARPFRFAGADYWDARSLAHAMANNWTEAARCLRREKIADWVLRSLGSKQQATLVDSRLRWSQLADGGDGSDENGTLAAVLTALDPDAPLRYKDLAAAPDALGQLLAIDFHRSERVQLFVELLREGSPRVWFESQRSTRPELLSVKKMIERASIIVDRPGASFGIERCLYLLNPLWPCQSPLLARDYVCQARELLPALERLAQDGTPAAAPVDRHVAAFCAARTRHAPERHLKNLSSERAETRHLAMLYILADLQHRFGPARLPALARWLAGLLVPIVESYHSRPYRKQLSELLQTAVQGGVLGEVYALLDNATARVADERAFAAARLQYRQAVAQVGWLEQGGLSGRDNVARVSSQLAGIISATLAGLMLVALTLFYVM